MSELAITAALARSRDKWSRLKGIGRAASEYLSLLVQAQRTWLIGLALGVGAAWLNLLPGVTVPGWAAAGIVLATMILAQFQAFCSLREERDNLRQARAVDGLLDEIALLRTREAELRNRVVRDHASYAQWKAELIALRAEIHKSIERISRAEAETFHVIGNLKHAPNGGVNEEHGLLLAVATRDLDHLADLIHGYTRFAD